MTIGTALMAPRQYLLRKVPTQSFKAIDGTVGYVFALMQKSLFPWLRELVKSGEAGSIHECLNKWEWDHNMGHINPSFPNFGLTPWQVISRAFLPKDSV